MSSNTPSDDAEKPVEFKFIPTGKELLRYHPDEDCIETKVEFANYPAGSKFYPPKPAEPEAEPVAWIKRQYAGTGNVLTSIFYCPEPGAIPLYTKPAEPEARKPMTDEELQACIPTMPKDGMFSLVDGKWKVSTQWVHEFARAVEKHHGIGDKDES